MEKSDIMDWIKEAGIQRRSLYSNGDIIQTDDYKRIEQILKRIPESKDKNGNLIPLFLTNKRKDENGRLTKKYMPETWFILDGWEGLGEYKKNSTGIWITEPILDLKQYGGNLNMMLPQISKQLEAQYPKSSTVLLIKNILETDKTLNLALRSWFTSDKYREMDITILIFVEDMSMFPEGVWSKAKIIDVPKSTEMERRECTIGICKQFHIDVEDPDIKNQIESAVRICAGMNLDQTDSAISECFIRHSELNMDTLAHIKAEMLGKDPTIEIIQRSKFGFNSVGMPEEIKTRINDDILLPIKNPDITKTFHLKPPRGFIFAGPPGNGKTILVKAIAKELNVSVIILKPDNVYSKYVGESERAIKRVFKIADSMSPVILFIDEVDVMGKRASMGGGDSGAQVHRNIFSMFLEKLGDENREWIFAGTTNRVEDIDEAMRRTGRIDSIVPVPFPDSKLRKEILEIHAILKRDLPLADDVDFSQLSGEDTYMWSGSDLESFVIRTSKYVSKRCANDKSLKRIITMKDFEEILGTFNIDTKKNEQLQNELKEQASRLTNDKRFLNIFDKSQKVVGGMSRAEKMEEMRSSKLPGGGD